MDWDTLGQLPGNWGAVRAIDDQGNVYVESHSWYSTGFWLSKYDATSQS
jgi:hypothetical protein